MHAAACSKKVIYVLLGTIAHEKALVFELVVTKNLIDTHVSSLQLEA
jgi:hypothetical protein